MDMTKEKAAAEIKRLRKQAENEKIPQEARNEMLDRANAIEYKFYEKETSGKSKKAKEEGMLSKIGGMYAEGAKMISEDINRIVGTKSGKELDKQKGRMSGLAKGGAVKKPTAKRDVKEYGGKEKYASKAAMMKHEKAESPAKEKKEKDMGKRSPVIAVMIGMTDKKKKMAKGGYVNCGASVKAAGGKK